MRDRLGEKGDTRLAALNQAFAIEAKTLILEGEVTDLAYAEGSKEPRSVFDRVTVHLTIYAAEG